MKMQHFEAWQKETEKHEKELAALKEKAISEIRAAIAEREAEIKELADQLAQITGDAKPRRKRGTGGVVSKKSLMDMSDAGLARKHTRAKNQIAKEKDAARRSSLEKAVAECEAELRRRDD